MGYWNDETREEREERLRASFLKEEEEARKFRQSLLAARDIRDLYGEQAIDREVLEELERRGL